MNMKETAIKFLAATAVIAAMGAALPAFASDAPSGGSVNSADANLESKKEAAKATVKGLTKLTFAQINQALKNIDNAKNPTDIFNAVKAARQQDRGARDVAKAVVNGLKNLTSEQINQALKNIDNAKDAATILAVLKDVRQQDKDARAVLVAKDLDSKKEAAKTIVNGLTKLTPEQSKQALKDVDNAKDAAALYRAVKDARQLDKDARAVLVAKDLESKKEAAKTVVNGLKKLTPAQRNQALKDVDSAKDVAALNAVVAAARQQDKGARDKAKAIVNGLKNLTPEQSKQALKDIDNAKDAAALYRAVKDARQLDKDARAVLVAKDLESRKKVAKAVVDGLKNLTPEQSKQALKDIDNAKDAATILAVLKTARQQDKDAKSEKRDNGIRDDLFDDFDGLFGTPDTSKDTPNPSKDTSDTSKDTSNPATTSDVNTPNVNVDTNVISDINTPKEVFNGPSGASDHKLAEHSKHQDQVAQNAKQTSTAKKQAVNNTLAVTGADVQLMFAVAVIMLAAGAALVARKKRA